MAESVTCEDVTFPRNGSQYCRVNRRVPPTHATIIPTHTQRHRPNEAHFRRAGSCHADYRYTRCNKGRSHYEDAGGKESQAGNSNGLRYDCPGIRLNTGSSSSRRRSPKKSCFRDSKAEVQTVGQQGRQRQVQQLRNDPDGINPGLNQRAGESKNVGSST